MPQKSGFQTGTDDPFAGLESTSSPTPIASTENPLAAAANVSLPNSMSTSTTNTNNKPPVTIQQQQQQPTAPVNPNLANIFSDSPRVSTTKSGSSVSPMVKPNNTNTNVRSPSPVVLPPSSNNTVSSPSPALSTATTRKTVDIPAPEEVGIVTSASSGSNASDKPIPTSTTAANTAAAAKETPKATATPPKKNVVPPTTTQPSSSSTTQKTAQLPPTSKSSTKQQSKQSTTTSVGGIGKSGAQLPTSANMTVALQSSSSVTLNPSNARFFNIYEFLAGADKKEPTRKFYPIERVKPFWVLLGLDVYVEKWRLDNANSKNKKGIGALLGAAGASLLQQSEDGNVQKGASKDALDSSSGKSKKGGASSEQPAVFTAAPMYEQLAKSLSFQCHLVQESERNMYAHGGKSHPLEYLRGNQIGLEACIKLISMLPHSAGASGKNLDALFLNFINTFVNLVGNIQTNQQLVMPGGWQTLDSAHVCLYILRNRGNSWSFSVVNTGPNGLEYHPSNFDNTTGRQTKQLCLTIWDIPRERIVDSTFWVLLFRMQVYPSKRNSADFLYTKLLTSLNSRPLLSNKDAGPAEFFYPPATASGAAQYHQLALLALTTIPELNSPSSKYSQLLVRNAAVEIAYRGIADARPSSMDPEDSRILQLTARNLANYASTLDPKELGMLNGGGDDMNALGGALNYTWELLDRLLGKLAVASSKPLDQHSAQVGGGPGEEQFGKGMLKNLRASEKSAAHPFFGRLRRDNYDEVVKALMGDPRPDPILIPAVLTDEGMPDVATDYHTAASSLLRICHACSLLLQQRRLVKNAPAFVASAAQYALTVTLPMPHLDPSVCFWRKSPMRRETQTNLLFLIRRMCRIYSAATSSVQQSRGLVGIRTTAFACGACVADAIARVKCTDDPSPFSLHYSGLNEGPTRPFGFESGSFESLAANLPIYDPQLTSLRFQCLDYMRGMTIKDDGTVSRL